MNPTVKTLAAVLVALFGSMPASGQRRQPALPNPGQEGYDWKRIARARGLAEKDVVSLEKNKVLMTNEAFKQVFTPYLGSGLPLFITSDSLLNAFHVLFEESILQLELANNTRLMDLLEALWSRLNDREKGVESNATLAPVSRKRAWIVIGVALALVGKQPKLENEDLAEIIAVEADKVIAANGRDKPAWLGPPEDDFIAIDYSRYRPRGFYTRNVILERHFRAVSWLQSIPFRIAKDEELLAALLLGHAARGLDLEVVRTYRYFIGTGDDWDLIAAAEVAGNPLNAALSKDGLEALRKSLKERAEEPGQAPLINDQVRYPPADPNVTAEPGFRVLPAYRTPDAVLFHRTADLRVFPNRKLPTGLDVCAALGSAFARERLAQVENGKLLEIIDANRGLFSGGESLYFQYLGCISALLSAPEPGAPAFMSSAAWQAKSCQTVLAGWAQLRHTWVLQAKQTVLYSGGMQPPHGFIEPTPCFFGRMSSLVRGTEEFLRSAGSFHVSRSALVSKIHDVIRMVNENDGYGSLWSSIEEYLDTDEENWGNLEPLPEKNLDLVSFLHRLRVHAQKVGIMGSFDRGKFGWSQESAIEFLEIIACKIADGNELFSSDVREYISKHSVDLAPLWQSLGEISCQLEQLARKQLDGQSLDEEENRFIGSYGSRIAEVMLNFGNSYLSPNDDAPRIVDVVFDPTEAPQYLHVGISRPRALYVLYPHQGREILCRGAVLPYYEFAHDIRLTDDRWKAMLDSEARPATPEWTLPIIGTGGIGAPGDLKNH